MTRPSCLTVQELASLVDSTVAGEERRRLVEHLASCERCYGVYAETVRLQEDDRKGGEVLDFGDRQEDPPSPVPLWRWAAAAAVAILAAMLVSPMGRDVLSGRGVLTADLPASQVGAHLHSSDDVLPFDDWTSLRTGGGYLAGLSEQERSVRLGAQTVDLEVALRTASVERARALLPTLTDLVRSFKGAESSAVLYRSLGVSLEGGQEPRSLLGVSRKAASSLKNAADSNYLALGRWAEAGRLAAASGDVRFLQRRAVRRFPERAPDLELPVAAAQSLASIAERLAGGVDARELPELQRDFTAVLARAGSPWSLPQTQE